VTDEPDLPSPTLATPDLPPLPTLDTQGTLGTAGLPSLPTLGGSPELPSLPSLGPVGRRPPVTGARRAWMPATVVAVRDETATGRTLRLELPPGSERHLPGQHYDVRLTAPDGSTAQRSYSIASAPAPVGPPGSPVRAELTVDRIADGDVSPYLHDEVGVGDRFEVRGPFGGWFVWRGDTPVLLLGGGSGVVPLMSMRRWWAELGRPVPLRLVVSARRPEDLFYASEYGEESTLVFSRTAPDGDPRPAGRLNAEDLRPLVQAALAEGATAYVCGSAGFAEAASQLVVTLGFAPADVRVERFGPS
jgi:ferredoxin-NADP reductase